jgi:hypothetical protein
MRIRGQWQEHLTRSLSLVHVAPFLVPPHLRNAVGTLGRQIDDETPVVASQWGAVALNTASYWQRCGNATSAISATRFRDTRLHVVAAALPMERAAVRLHLAGTAAMHDDVSDGWMPARVFLIEIAWRT